MEEHECKEKSPRSLIFKSGGAWRIVIEEYGDHAIIKYCPYCGEVL